MRAEIAEYCFYQTRSKYNAIQIFFNCKTILLEKNHFETETENTCAKS